MFQLLQIFDRIILKSEEIIEIPIEEIVLIKIREKYLGKLIPDKGIAISIKSLVLLHNTIVEIEGVINFEYNVEIIVLNPKHGDLLYGKIENFNNNGIILNCELFKVFVPKQNLPDNTIFLELVDNSFYYDKDELCRVKIIETKSLRTDIIKKIDNKNLFNKSEMILEISDVFEVTGSFNQSGLGPVTWWK